MLATPIYDPQKSWGENFSEGPFGEYADGKLFEEKGEPQHTFLGNKVYLPFGIPAGPLPTSRHVKSAFDKGFDVNVYKTQRSTFFASNAFPNVLYLDLEGDLSLEKASQPIVGKIQTDTSIENLTITNSFGNPSSGPDYWIEDLRKAVTYQKKGQLLIMSIVGTIQEGFGEKEYYQDFADTAKLAVGTGVAAIEANLSCPNVASEGVLCYTPATVEEIVKKIKEAIGDIPLVAKLGYFSSEQQELLEDVIQRMKPYVQAVAAINTLAAPIVNDKGEQALPGKGRLKSGVCGAGIKWAGLDMVQRLAQLRDHTKSDFEIIGIGGVMTPSDYKLYKDVGADCVMSATGAMWNPYLAQEIKKPVT